MHRSNPITVRQTPLIVLLGSQLSEGLHIPAVTPDRNTGVIFGFAIPVPRPIWRPSLLAKFAPLLTIPTPAFLILVTMSPSFLTCLVTVFHQVSHSRLPHIHPLSIASHSGMGF